jgi:phospholipid/cholesterol/gamma-HCH transport system permease protein
MAPCLAVAAGGSAGLQEVSEAGAVVLRFRGTLDVAAAASDWTATLAAAKRAHGRPLVLDVTDVASLDTAGAALLLAAERAHGGEADWRGMDSHETAIVKRMRGLDVAPPQGPPPAPQTWGQVISASAGACVFGIAYLGEVAVAFVRLPTRLRMFRFSDFWRTADLAGVQALPLILLLGSLVGVILAFQSLIPMRRFGADIYVANLVSIGLARELGALLAAIILAGRSGSAFAAEIGTMKVNQELDALTTMGIDPVTMLVLPRLLAALLVMPVLTVAMELSGILGMTLVLVANGIPWTAVANQIIYTVQPGDFFGGLFKAALFGAAVAAIGCRAGLATGQGPRAVGLSATAAVVGGIVATIVLDGLLAVVFFRLGL